MDPQSADKYERVFTALAHPARRRILTGINFAGGTLNAGRIAAMFASAWPTITRHLQQLQEAGLVTVERRGRERLYRLEAQPLALARDWLDWFDKDPVTALRKDTSDGSDSGALQTQRRGRRD